MRKVFATSLCAMLGAGGLFSGEASGSLILYEGFNYAAGQGLENQINSSVVGGPQDWDRAGTSATPTALITSGSIANPVAGQPASTGNKITIGGSVTTRADRLNFPNMTSGTVYYSILVNPADIDGQFQNPATAAGVFSFAFNNGIADAGTNTAPTIVGTRFQIRRDPSEAAQANGTIFNIGTFNASGAANWDATQYAEGSTIMIVGSYEFVGALGGPDDIARLWINPNPATFDPATTTPNAMATGGDVTGGIQSIILRQTGGQPTVLNLDEIYVGTTYQDVFVPEPASLALLSLASIGVLNRRRRG